MLVTAMSWHQFSCHGLSNIVVVSCYLDLNQSPSFTNDKLKNQRTKERQADVGFGSSLTDKHNNFCLDVMNLKLSNGIAGNE